MRKRIHGLPRPEKLPWDERLPLEAADMVIRARIENGMTQARLARKMGTKQPAVARLEDGAHLPSLRYLVKAAKALGKKVKITLI